MRKKSKIFLHCVILVTIIITYSSCKKEETPVETNLSHQNQLNEIVKSANLKRLMEGKVSTSFRPRIIKKGIKLRTEKGGEELESISLNTPCNYEQINMDITNFVIDFGAPSGCQGSYTYDVTVHFTLTNNGTATFIPANVLTDMTLVGNNYNDWSAVTNSHVTTVGNVYSFVADIDFNLPALDYCSTEDMTFSSTFQVSCLGIDYWVEPYIIFDLTDIPRCSTVSPIFVQDIGSLLMSVSGWLLPCSTMPCHFASPDEYEFQYRKQGNSTWITPGFSPAGYLAGAYSVNVSSSGQGTYEYRWRNKETTPASCTGPYSDIKSVFID
jgi:hypothetical protein